MGSLRGRLALLIGGAAALVAMAALGLLWSLHAAEGTLDATLDAQLRLERLAELSGRMTEFGLAAIEAVGDAPGRPERLATARIEVDRALEAVDRSLGQAIAGTDALLGRTQYAARSRPLSSLRAPG